MASYIDSDSDTVFRVSAYVRWEPEDDIVTLSWGFFGDRKSAQRYCTTKHRQLSLRGANSAVVFIEQSPVTWAKTE